MPQSHAHLVHRLLSQYFEGKTDWVKKYPTSRCVPTVGVTGGTATYTGGRKRSLTASKE